MALQETRIGHPMLRNIYSRFGGKSNKQSILFVKYKEQNFRVFRFRLIGSGIGSGERKIRKVFVFPGQVGFKEEKKERRKFFTINVLQSEKNI